VFIRDYATGIIARKSVTVFVPNLIILAHRVIKPTKRDYYATMSMGVIPKRGWIFMIDWRITVLVVPHKFAFIIH
jgi:hypothetical protein